MANIPKVNGDFKLTITSSSQTYTDTLYTDNKAISGDIILNITAQSGSASIDGTTITPTFSQNGNVITVTGGKTVTGGVTPGWIDSISSGNVDVSGVYTIPSGSASINSTTITASGTQNANVITISGSKTITALVTPGYITSVASANVNVVGTFTMPLATTATTTIAYGTRIWNVTPSTSDQRLKITAGYIGNSDIKVSGAASFNGKYTM